ncbi:peptidoglycan-binding protein [Actinorhabdospora filicis]|uniref:peptidoglycan-binding domain-containing protein n=1 Tax=Actinorhabdospora filicis TaxID=1785913 RepID=UPI003D7FD543
MQREKRVAPPPARRPPSASAPGLLSLQSLAGNLAVSRLVAGGVLRRGSRGPEVAELQRRLGVRADGEFGPGTEKAVKAFQSAHGLKPDGIAGKDTRAALDKAAAPAPAAPPIPGPVPASGPPGTPFGPPSIPPFTAPDDRDLPAFIAARAELKRFLAQGHLLKKNHQPSTGVGGFNVDYAPAASALTALFPVHFEFRDGVREHTVFHWPGGKVTDLPFPIPEGEDPRAISRPETVRDKVGWTQARQDVFRQAFRDQVQDTWNKAAFVFHCHHDWWETLLAQAKVVVTDRTGEATTPPDVGALWAVIVTAGANPDPAGPERSHVGARSASLFEEDRDTADGANVLGHESGHMLGLGDEYFDAQNVKPGRAQHSDLVNREFGHHVDRQDAKSTTRDKAQSLMLTHFGTVHPELAVTLLEALVEVSKQEWHLRPKPPRPIPPGGLFQTF